MDDKYLEMEFKINNLKWEEKIGYDIEKIVSEMGYTFTKYTFDDTKEYHNENGNIARLTMLSPSSKTHPEFREYTREGQISEILFKQFCSVGIIANKNAVIQLGTLNHSDFEMAYYQNDVAIRMFYYQNGLLERGAKEPKASAYRYIYTTEPLERIIQTYDWANEIRNNMGLNPYPTPKKKIREKD